MFYFGTPEDNARLAWENATSITGPVLPECHYDEMSEQELRNALTYCFIAVKDSLREELPEEAIAILIEQYDEVFQALAGVSQRFREAVEQGKVQFPVEYTRENVDKYKILARG